MEFDTAENIKYFVDRCHTNAKNKGFWSEDKPNIPRLLMLVVSELAEAFDYKNKDNFEEELADAYIRLCDICGGLKIPPSIPEPEFQTIPPLERSELGNYLMGIVFFLSEALEADRKDDDFTFEQNINLSFSALFGLCYLFEIDLDKAVVKKMEYNEKRPYKHGKKY